jgi:hypothetical protein
LATGDPEKTCRGLLEPTVVELSDGRIAMICRGDNGAYPERPGYKWLLLSDDGGESWSEPTPLGCTDGEPVESPSSGSAVFRSIRDGRLYWIANLCLGDERPRGNRPRDRLVFVELQEEPFALKRDTLISIDQRGPDDSPSLGLSNFRFYQDRDTGNVVLFLTRHGERSAEGWQDADYYRYEIRL